jgi:hypothetical protein
MSTLAIVIVITSLIAMACPHGDSKECKEYRTQGLRCQDCEIGNFLRANPVAHEKA